MISSYSKVNQLGHYMIEGLLDGPVVVEEKIDGSQFSFANLDGKLHCRSRSADIDLDNVNSLFGPAVDSAKRLFAAGALPDGTVFRGEAMHRPKHNVMCYGRMATGGVYLFDVELAMGTGTFARPADKIAMANEFGLEPVRVLASGAVAADEARAMLDTVSVLGGGKIEGVVIKNYDLFTKDGKLACGKIVSSDFKEMHRREWKPVNRSSIEAELASKYCTEARWHKAVQHLAESGELKGGPEDIGPLMRELHRDVMEECGRDIAMDLLSHHRKSILKLMTAGMPAWYKERLGVSV